jgi:hexosaminidase
MRRPHSARSSLLTALTLFVAVTGLTLGTGGPAHAVTGTPQTVPALRTWTAGTGSFTFGAGSRISVDPGYAAELDDDAATFAEDLRTLTGRPVTVTHDDPVSGDVRLTLGGQQPAEGYTMSVAGAVTIQGSADTGVFWGTRTVLQLLRQSPTIPAGTATDSPTKPERGMMVDVGRKFLTVDWLRRHIRELAYLKQNVLHLHLSEAQGFRLESRTHPEIVAAAHYSYQDIADLVALGQQYHVMIIPEIDMPGHMGAILAVHPELRLADPTGKASPDFVDLSKDAAYTLMRDLITEYLPLFPAPYWHLGADEYVTNYADYPQLLTYARAHYGINATAKDAYYGFVNWADQIVRGAGKTMRMWNDGIKSGDGTVAPASDILVEYWAASGLTPQQLLDAGHTVANESWDPTYYVLGGTKPDTRWGYETWTPDLFEGGTTIGVPARNSGSNLHVWCDNPAAETESQIAAGIRFPLRVIAQRTWGSPPGAASTYAAFIALATSLAHAPGGPTDDMNDLALGRPVTVSSTETPDFPGGAAVDGNGATRWSSSYVDPSWIRIDFGRTVAISQVTLRWETAYGRAYQIQTSYDGGNWTTMASTGSGDGGIDEFTGLHGTGRYLRVYGTARGTGYGYSLWSIEVYGGVNLAQGRPVSVSSTETASFPAPYAVDGSLSTRWSSLYEDPSWITVDLGSDQKLRRVVLRWETAYASAYQVQLSPDGTTWTTVYTTISGDGGTDDLTISGTGRFLRVWCNTRATIWGYSLWEVEAYA